MSTFDESRVVRSNDGKFAGFVGAEQDGGLTDEPLSDSVADVKQIISSRADELSRHGFVPAQGLRTTLGDPRYAGDQDHLETWWGAEKSIAEYGRPGGDYRQMPDNFTPNQTPGRGTDDRRRTHRMHYEGSGVSLRMPSATSIRAFEKEKPGKSIVVPVTAKTPHGDVTGWVRLTKSRTGNHWSASAGGFGNDAAGAERAADMAEAVSCVMESRRVTSALRNAGDLSERRKQRLAAEGSVTQRVNSSFITSIGYNEAAGAIAVDIRGRTYGYSASSKDMADFVATSRVRGVGHAYNAVVKRRLPREPLSVCGTCGSNYPPHLNHRCRVAAVSGGASKHGYERGARTQAAGFAGAIKQSMGGPR